MTMTQSTTRLLSQLLNQALTAREMRPWEPPTDVYRLTDGWLIKFEMAGVEPDEISLAIDGPRVIVRGTRLDHCLECGCSVHQMEITYSRFERSVTLPEDPAPAQVKYEFRNGMLLVRIVKDLTNERTRSAN
jgi:HSP20 family protein